MRRRSALGFLVVSVIAVAACGSKSDGGSTSSEVATTSAASTSAAASEEPATSAVNPDTTAAPATPTEPSKPTSWSWDETSGSYVPTGPAPDCPTPLIEAGGLIDLSTVKSKLIPGQVRDGEYLINGTFRWSGPDDPYPTGLTVTMPFDGYVTGAWQFLKSGAYLFGLNIVHPCGLMLRLSKMHDPSPEVKSALLDPLGEAREKDSRETFLNPGVWLTKGTVIATSVGIPAPNPQSDVIGAQLDVAILDLRERNPQIPADFDFTRWSGSAAPQYVFYAHCFYQGDYLAKSDQELIEKLKLGGGSAESDTCVAA